MPAATVAAGTFFFKPCSSHSSQLRIARRFDIKIIFVSNHLPVLFCFALNDNFCFVSRSAADFLSSLLEIGDAKVDQVQITKSSIQFTITSRNILGE